MKKKISKLNQTESADNLDSTIGTEVKELETVEKKYKEVIDTSKMIAAQAPPLPQVSSPAGAAGASRIGATVQRLEKGLTRNDQEAAEYIDNALLKHIEAVLPSVLPKGEQVNETHAVEYHADGTLHLDGEADHPNTDTTVQEIKKGALEAAPVPYVSPAV